MVHHLTKVPPRFFAASVGSGLLAGLLVFLTVQSMPLFGWILWIVSIVAVAACASLWYRNEFFKLQKNLCQIRREISGTFKVRLLL